MNDPVLLERQGALATLTLNRPSALNTLDFLMMEALIERTRELATDESLRCILVRGAGKHFMAGGDIKTFALSIGSPGEERQALFTRRIGELHAAIETLQRLPTPVIAAVHGAVAGFGLSLMLACDLVVATDTSYYSSAYRNIGLTPDGGCTYFLPRVVGVKKAMEIVLLGERFDAAAAERLGLVNWVVPEAELDGKVDSVVKAILEGPEAALGGGKLLVNQSLAHSLSEQLHTEALSFGACAGTPDFTEGIAAFLEKRAPKFS
jgi:2-(1,2-epoxy-1,2-dihydrophenyl)acetyl-CoA isomerase